ncbi:GGDEF domain-containing protein [Acidovorax sp.]|uniref:GGDEF domain-containing protein n=1 Tax=Acidovorax sp. TaxID=1872122 RepID=UPI00261514B0|nr:GGDEF domain-containing protein [Acidovorax sp.]
MQSHTSIIFALVGTQFGLYASAWWVYAALADEDRAAAGYWGLFNVLVGVGMLLAWSRDESRSWAAYVGSSICFVTSFLAGWRGISALVKLKHNTRTQLILLIAICTALVLIGPSLERAPFRVFVTYFGCALIIGLGVYQTTPLNNQELHLTWSKVLRMSSLAGVLLLGGQALQQMLHPDAQLELNNGEGPNTQLLLGLLVAASIFNFTCLGLQLLRYMRQLRELTYCDPLTGLLNRRAFEEAMQREWARRRREPAPLAVAAFDLDHFKAINDSHGHSVGDLVLIQAAKVLRGLSREIDLVARLGGEEFVVVMPGASLVAAQAAAERLREALAAEPATSLDGIPLHITTSIGLAMAEDGDSDVHATLRRADDALYQAKHEGRDRVCTASRPTASSTVLIP